ncbi:Protein of unknown function [Bacillus cereus]|nr:Protein of unknown function [Bacillus cereus]
MKLPLLEVETERLMIRPFVLLKEQVFLLNARERRFL